MLSMIVPFVRPHRLHRCCSWIWAFPLILVGCSAPEPVIRYMPAQLPSAHPMPQVQAVNCSGVWAAQNAQTQLTLQYWLKAMECALELSPAQARSEVSHQADDSWQGTLRSSILLGKARITPDERSQQVAALDAMRNQVPLNLRILYQLWRDSQANEYALSQARARYSKLQQTSDKQIDDWRNAYQQQQQLLLQTQQKLQTLTDIERQLSNRKSSTMETHSAAAESRPQEVLFTPQEDGVVQEVTP